MQSRGNNKKIQMSKYMVYIVLAVVFVFFAITLRDNGFASTQNLLNILRQTAMISIMSVAGVFVLSAGQIDLTVGSNTAMSAMLVALVLKSTNNIFLALIVALIFGVAVGVINGACNQIRTSCFPCYFGNDAGDPRCSNVDYKYRGSADFKYSI